MHSIDSYVRWEPGCEIELPDISSLKGSNCIMTMQAPCKNTIPLPSLLPTREAVELWLIIQTISPYFRSMLLISHCNAMHNPSMIPIYLRLRCLKLSIQIQKVVALAVVPLIIQATLIMNRSSSLSFSQFTTIWNIEKRHSEEKWKQCKRVSAEESALNVEPFAHSISDMTSVNPDTNHRHPIPCLKSGAQRSSCRATEGIRWHPVFTEPLGYS